MVGRGVVDGRGAEQADDGARVVSDRDDARRVAAAAHGDLGVAENVDDACEVVGAAAEAVEAVDEQPAEPAGAGGRHGGKSRSVTFSAAGLTEGFIHELVDAVRSGPAPVTPDTCSPMRPSGLVVSS